MTKLKESVTNNTVAADAVSAATIDVVHIGIHDGNRFLGDDQFWPISMAAALASNNLRRYGLQVAVSHFAKYQHSVIGAAAMLSRQ